MEYRWKQYINNKYGATKMENIEYGIEENKYCTQKNV